MNKKTAQELYDLGFEASQALLKILELKDKISSEEFEAIKKGVGISFGQIDWYVLSVLTKQYPELDRFKPDENAECNC